MPPTIPVASLVALAAVAHGANLIVDGGFEQAGLSQVGSNAYGSFDITLVQTGTAPIQGWQTTVGQRLEVWRTGFDGIPSAASSTYFAELNAEQVATLFQVVQLDSSSSVGYSLAHHGRNGVDVMDLVIYDLGTSTGWSEGQGSVVYSQRISDSNNRWGYYGNANIFTSVAGHYYAFTFVSVSAAGGSVAQGNLLDNVQFGYDLVIPVPESSTYGLGLGGLALAAVAIRRRRSK